MRLSKKHKWAVALATSVFAFYVYFNLHGCPYEARKYSPNKIFYYQRFRSYGLVDLLPRMATPGNGSDWMYDADGYVRVYRVDGDQWVAGIFVHGVPLASADWLDNGLLVYDGDGSGRVDNELLELPGSPLVTVLRSQ